MPLQAASSVENNFKNGLVSEATGLNFPESACTETFDCVFNLTGSVERREGIDFENNFSVKAIPSSGVITNYHWRDVAGNGNIYLIVAQIGTKLYFYDASTTDPISSHPIASNIDLTVYSPSGAASPNLDECQFSSGNGLLFVTHPLLEAFYVSYDANTQTVTGTQLDLTIRDFTGIADTTPVDTRPTTSVSGMTIAHHYNLLNQGWTETNLATWDAGRTDMPSDVDVMWRFKNTSEVFDLATIANVVGGNSPSPKGHFTLNVFKEDRATPTGLLIANVTTSTQRCSTNAFFAGRVFYSGINYVGYNSKIYFTQIVERPTQYSYCYQTNDPTAEDLFDLLPTDGGVINIQEAGTIIKLLPIAGGLGVFASNGIWLITGSTGIGFTASDYSISKISSIRCLSHTSFLDIAGSICFWNLEGIYLVSPTGQYGSADVKSISHDRILSYFYAIPPSAKRNARGYFNTVTGVVQWLFRSSEAGTVQESYQFDSILNYNVFTNAFYPWRISDSDVKLNSIIVIENLGGAVQQENVVDQAVETIVDQAGDTIIVFSINDGIVVPKFKYFVNYASSGTGQFTFAEARDFTYVDWMSYDNIGVNYTSTFTSGYKLRGDAIRKFQPTWLKVYSDSEQATQYTIQGLWDYATDPNTGRWSPTKIIAHPLANYANLSKRIKIRGHGVVLQFRVQSVTNQPFNIIGWAEYTTGNSAP